MKNVKTMKNTAKRLLAALLSAAMLFLCAAPACALSDDYLDLTTISPKSASVGWGSLKINTGLDGQPIDMANESGGTTVYPHGFTAHASSALEFDISGVDGVKAFTSFIGAEHAGTNGATDSTSISFAVYADGVKLYESGRFLYNTPAEEIFVPLPAGTRILKLTTDDLGVNTGDHSAWGSPRLYVGDLDLSEFKDLTLRADHGVYPANRQVALETVCRDYAGNSITPDSVSYFTDDPTVALVSDSGVVTPQGKSGRVTVTATVVSGQNELTGQTVLTFLAQETDASAPYGRFYDLSFADPADYSVGWGDLAVNTGLDGKVLDMANESGGTTVYPHGFTAHASSLLNFDISQLTDTRLFSAYIGLEHSSGNSTSTLASVSFSVWADGIKLYESGVFGYNDPAEEIFVAIPEGTATLTLKTHAGDSNYGDHSAWGAPRLLTDEGAFGVFRTLEVSAEKRVYLTGSEFELAVSCVNLGGETFTPETLTFASDDPATASVSSEGRVTALHEGDAVITVTASYGGVTKTASLPLSFLDVIEEKEFALTSPGGVLTAKLFLDGQGRLSYTVAGEDLSAVLGRSYIGFETEQCDFSSALVFREDGELRTVDESYSAPSGKRSVVRNFYNEKTYSFARSGYFFDVTVRLYDDGFAYRFAVRGGVEGETLTVKGETSSFALPQRSKIYAEFISSLTSTFCYESSYSAADTETVPSPYICMPATVELYENGAPTGKYLLLSEADCFSHLYPGSVFTYDTKKKDGVLGLTFAPVAASNDVVTVENGFVSPWRYGIYGDLATLFESDMTEKLNPAPEGDFSWVEPGVTAWMWLSEGFGGQRSESTIREYVDLAAQMGWKYLILDEGWQPSSKVPGKVYDGYFDYFEELVSYAESKGVGFIAWVKYCDLDTPEEREILGEWARIGIKGIKADFFDSENAATMEGFRAIYEKCAENRLLLNCHGASKPTGERRTWPNVINREAVNGEEYGGLWMDGAMYWAFARGIVGPVDITPRLYSTSGNSTVAQMACSVVFESGMPCMASDSEDYLAFSAGSFFKGLPAAWDDTRLLEGKIGSYVTTARRAGNEWYLGAMTASARSSSVSLDFLGNGLYTAYIYSESSRREVTVTERTVTKNDTLSFSMMQKGGYIVRFVKKAPSCDVSGNGTVNINDVTVLLNYLSSHSGELDFRYDVNDDGFVDISDVTAVLDYISKH